MTPSPARPLRRVIEWAIGRDLSSAAPATCAPPAARIRALHPPDAADRRPPGRPPARQARDAAAQGILQGARRRRRDRPASGRAGSVAPRPGATRSPSPRSPPRSGSPLPRLRACGRAAPAKLARLARGGVALSTLVDGRPARRRARGAPRPRARPEPCSSRPTTTQRSCSGRRPSASRLLEQIPRAPDAVFGPRRRRRADQRHRARGARRLASAADRRLPAGRLPGDGRRGGRRPRRRLPDPRRRSPTRPPGTSRRARSPWRSARGSSTSACYDGGGGRSPPRWRLGAARASCSLIEGARGAERSPRRSAPAQEQPDATRSCWGERARSSRRPPDALRAPVRTSASRPRGSRADPRRVYTAMSTVEGVAAAPAARPTGGVPAPAATAGRRCGSSWRWSRGCSGSTTSSTTSPRPAASSRSATRRASWRSSARLAHRPRARRSTTGCRCARSSRSWRPTTTSSRTRW